MKKIKIKDELKIWNLAMFALTSFIESKNQGIFHTDRMKNYSVKRRTETLKAEYEEQED